ncbi:MAG: hypothetical protein ACYC3S_08825 [Chloroflexota bacterium]
MPKRRTGLLVLVAAVLAVGAFAAWPREAAAQCGSSVSSCKDCHEVKKQAPVNANGLWHTSHAFGDFCEFCHAGNVKGKDKPSAHAGLINPLSDIKGSCQSCHPNDYTARGEKFTTILGKPLGSGAAPATTPVAGALAASTDPGSCGPSAPTGGQTIDLNKVFANDAGPGGLSSGNLILYALVLATAVLLGGLVFYYEHPVARSIAAFRRLGSLPAGPPATAGNTTSDLATSLAERPELSSLLPLLLTSDRETLRALSHIFADRESGARVIKAAGHLDLRVLTAMGEADQKALSALLSLAKEMGA